MNIILFSPGLLPDCLCVLLTPSFGILDLTHKKFLSKSPVVVCEWWHYDLRVSCPLISDLFHSYANEPASVRENSVQWVSWIIIASVYVECETPTKTRANCKINIAVTFKNDTFSLKATDFGRSGIHGFTTELVLFLLSLVKSEWGIHSNSPHPPSRPDYVRLG